MVNMRTEVWNVCSRFGGKYEVSRDQRRFTCTLKDGEITYDVETKTLSGRFGPVEFEATDISEVKYIDVGVVFIDARGTRVGLLFDRAVTAWDQTPANLKVVTLSHPDPFWPTLRGASLSVNLRD